MDNLVTEKLRGVEIRLVIKPGVFAKGGVDDGTKLLLNSLEIKDGTLVCDLGTGGGVIGIICAKLNPSGHVHLLEDHLSSSELAKKNVERNDIRNAEVYLSDLFSAVGKRTYHLIVSNPPQHLGNEFLDRVAEECFQHLKPGGQVYWVIQKHVKPFAIRLFEKHFGNSTITAQGKEHLVLSAQRKK